MRDIARTRAPRRTTAMAVLPIVVLVLAACSSAGTSQAPGGSQGAGGGTTVTMSGLAFTVAEITVPVGNVTFVNSDGVPHNVVEGTNGKEVADPRITKTTIAGGTQADVAFSAAGDYQTTCTIHPTMNMVVHVQ